MGENDWLVPLDDVNEDEISSDHLYTLVKGRGKEDEGKGKEAVNKVKEERKEDQKKGVIFSPSSDNSNTSYKF